MTDGRPIPKFFQQDKLLRDENYRILGRVLLRDDQIQENQPIAVILLQVPRQYMADVRGKVFHIDGKKYVVPADLPQQKIGGNALLVFANNFYLQPL